MIIKIDVAPEIEAGYNLQRLLPLILGAIIALGIGYELPYFWAQAINQEAEEYRQKTQEKQSKLASLQIDMKKMDEIEKLVADLEQRRAVIGSIALGKKQSVYLLDKLQEIQLEKMWLTSLELTTASTSGVSEVTLEGWATNYSVISEYLKRIKKISTKQDAAIIDPKNFTPDFSQEISAQKVAVNPKANQNMPVPLEQGVSDNKINLFISDVMLENLIKENNTNLNMPIQQFKIKFKPSIDLSFVVKQ